MNEWRVLVPLDSHGLMMMVVMMMVFRNPRGAIAGKDPGVLRMMRKGT